MARRGLAWSGTARWGAVGQGKGFRFPERTTTPQIFRRGSVRHGSAWFGMAGRGRPWCGRARLGPVWQAEGIRLLWTDQTIPDGQAWRGTVRQGVVGRGAVGLGWAWYGDPFSRERTKTSDFQ